MQRVAEYRPFQSANIAATIQPARISFNAVVKASHSASVPTVMRKNCATRALLKLEAAKKRRGYWLRPEQLELF